ncbi:MAG: ABC transporter permease, partial [Acidobacteriota bacterium]|nr:ABC transporter permease [Acidobacteriota bacterium]
MKSYIALIKIDIKLALRARSVIFFNYLFPLVFFFVFAQSFHAEQGGYITQVVTMVAVIGTLGNGLFGAGMRAVQERETNVLRRYKVTPISPAPLLVASMVTGLLLYLPYIAIMLILAKTIYEMAMPEHLISVLLFISLGVVTFRAIGLIVASVVNSMQESVILVQLLYISMLFLSGASFPVTMFPPWLLTITQFIPATYLVSGLQGIMLRNETFLQNWQAVAALILTMLVAMFVSIKLFRWEKEEKIRTSAKLWLIAVLLPFILLGAYQAYSKENVNKTKILARDLRRSRTLLIRNARIFEGGGKVIESGSILVKNGKIEEVYDGAAPDPKQLKAEPVEAAGKTVLPGLIDAHIHLGAPGGFYESSKDYEKSDRNMQRALSAYLYSGVTAVKSAGDMLDSVLKIRARTNSGEKLGAELLICGPLFTTAGGHGTEYFKPFPEQIRRLMNAQFTRLPTTPREAGKQVDELKKAGVDGIKAVLEGGAAGALFNRMDPAILNAIAAEARAQHLPVVVHTGDSADVADALRAGVDGIEHGSFRDKIPDALFQQMAANRVTYDPTLSVVEGFQDLAAAKADALSRSLVQQVGPPSLLTGTRKMLNSPQIAPYRERLKNFPMDMALAKANLLRAWHFGVMLVTGSDAGNPLVIHGPTV